MADGFIGAPPINAYNMFREIVNYYVTYNLFVENTAYIVNKDKWESLSDEDRDLIEAVFAKESRKSFAECEKQDNFYLNKMAESNIHVVSLSDTERENLAHYVRQKTWPKLEKKFGKELLDGLKQDL